MKIKSFEHTYKENKQKIETLKKELTEEMHKIDELHDVLANLKRREHTLSDKITERKDYVELYEKINNTTEVSSPNLEESRAVEAVKKDAEANRSDKVKETLKEAPKSSETVSDVVNTKEPDKNEVLFVVEGKGRKGRIYDAKLVLEDETYKVLAGSLISSVVGDYPSNNAIPLREVNDNAIDENYLLTADVTFHNLYSAVTFILGYNSKNSSELTIETKTGLTYKEYMKQEVSNG